MRAHEQPRVLLIGTLDTKGPEIKWVAERLAELSTRAVILDSGIRGTPTIAASIPREDVASASGSSLDALRQLDRGEAIARMAVGVESIAVRLVNEGAIAGCLCVGGAGVVLAARAFDAVGLGVPKLMVTPLASGERQFDMFVGTGDVAVLHSVADIMGMNRITREVLGEAAAMIAGAVNADGRMEPAEALQSTPIAASMNGNTTPALSRALHTLAADGFELITFHANGVGGRAMEDLIEDGMFAGVLDYTTTELGAEEVGGLMNAGEKRMETAGRLGIPQVLVPGCLDMITVGSYEQAVQDYPGRTLYRHNPALTLVRLNDEEMAGLGARFADRANRAIGPVSVWIPTEGFSMIDVEGGPFWDPAADDAFVSALSDALRPSVDVHVVEAHINDDAFVDQVVAALLAELSRTPTEVAHE